MRYSLRVGEAQACLSLRQSITLRSTLRSTCALSLPALVSEMKSTIHTWIQPGSTGTPPPMARAAYCFFGLALLALSSCPSWARAADAGWAALQQTYFPGKQLEPAAFVRLTAPARAPSGEQVPFAFSIDHPMLDKQYIKSVTVLVDENPVPLTAVFHFTPDSGKAEVATRIRFEIDSPVHVVAETSDGRFYVNSTVVKASGGCGGPATGDNAAAMAAAGKMKMALDGPFRPGSVNKARLLIKHPMYTGLQRDPATNGFRPALFIDKVEVSYNGKPVMRADTYIGISEDPSIQFSFLARQPGALQVSIRDNEGRSFRHALEIGG
ncbi:MAG: quinoprotein dehydrogenase-associated SoxYZ-like carrier [Pseudomonadota bacterium]